MVQRTVFCVRAFRRDQGRLVEVQTVEYPSASEAEEVGARLSRSAAGVVVYSLEGAPEVGAWGEPELFATHGDTPKR